MTTEHSPVVPYSDDEVISEKEIRSRPSWFARAGVKVGLGVGDAERDRFTFALLIIVFSVCGMFYGLSPLVLPVSEVFDENGGESYTGGIFLYSAVLG